MQALRLRLWSAYLGFGPAADRLLQRVEATRGELAAQEAKLVAMRANAGRNAIEEAVRITALAKCAGRIY